MGCDNNEDNFVLTIMLALGVCLCVIAFFCGGEMMMKVPTWIRCVICIAAGLISLAVCAIVLCFCVSSVCKVFNCCKAIKISEKEYFVLTKENINNRCTLENQRNILVYDDITCIFPHQFSGYYNLEKIEFYGKVRIQEASFFGCTNLNEVVFHNDITFIMENAFAGCKKLETINYSGTKEEWEKITFGNNWKKDIPAKVVTCSDGIENLDSDNNSDDSKPSDKITQ